jgi:hypothetical protein
LPMTSLPGAKVGVIGTYFVWRRCRVSRIVLLDSANICDRSQCLTKDSFHKGQGRCFTTHVTDSVTHIKPEPQCTNHHTFTPQFTGNLNTHHVQQRIHLRPWPRSIRLQARPIYIGRRNHQRHCRGSPQAEDDEPTPKRTETLLTVATLVMKTHAPDVDVMGDPTAEVLEDGFDALQRICPDEERIWLEEAKQQADLPHVPQEMR